MHTDTLDVKAVFEAAWREIDKPSKPEHRALWEQCVQGAFVPDGWHDKPAPGEPWWWHASALCQCPRQAVLRRADLDTDGTRVESRNTFAIGHTYHALARFGMHMLGGFEQIQTEVGGHHPGLPLAARADLIYRHDGEDVILDWKTESSFAGKHRREEAQDGSSARHEHRIQVTAGSLVLEALQPGLRFERGQIAYVDKESGAIDLQPVTITPELRLEVQSRLESLELAWAEYEVLGILPDMLPAEQRQGKPVTPWQCRPRSASDARGLYCPARSVCMEIHAKEAAA